MKFDLRIEDLSLNFGQREVFRNFYLHSQSRITIIRGPSGCGKTTLLKLVGGLLVPASAAGIYCPRPTFLVLQNDSLPPWLSARRTLAAFRPSTWEKMTQSVLFRLISDFVDQPIHTLSYGQRRSVEVLAALHSDAATLLLDEPFNFLDRERRNVFLEFIADKVLCQKKIIITSHYLEGFSIDDSKGYEFKSEFPHHELVELGNGEI